MFLLKIPEKYFKRLFSEFKKIKKNISPKDDNILKFLKKSFFKKS